MEGIIQFNDRLNRALDEWNDFLRERNGKMTREESALALKFCDEMDEILKRQLALLLNVFFEG